MPAPIHPLPVLLDVDTGTDDALALLLALRSPRLDVRAITCVAGNHGLDQVVINTLKVLDVADAPDIPVAAGAERPLLETMRRPSYIHGQDGMGDLGLPPSSRQPLGIHAVELMRRTVSESPEPVTLIALAPLTNVALFLRLYPRLAERLRGLTIMGGTFAAHGNTSPTAEFNVRSDPEAAAIVLESGLPIRLYPLDVFRQVSFSRPEIEGFMASDDPTAQMAGRILHFWLQHTGAERALIGDAGAVATVVDPEGATVLPAPVTVALEGDVTRGQTVLDRRPVRSRANLVEWWQTSQSEVDVVTEVAVERYRRLFAEAIGAGEVLA